jgi:hypothetical protein
VREKALGKLTRRIKEKINVLSERGKPAKGKN